MLQVKLNKSKKLLKVEIQDVGINTPFLPHVIADMLTSVWEVTQKDNKFKFEYYKQNGDWGFRAIRKEK